MSNNKKFLSVKFISYFLACHQLLLSNVYIVSVFTAMYGFVICSCVYVIALVFLSVTGTGTVSS